MARISKAMAILVASFGVSACDDGSGMTFVAEGGPKAAAPAAARFEGTWAVTSGSHLFDCGVASTTAPVVDDVTWARGVASDLEQHAARVPCTIHADVIGATAQGRPETCAYTGDDGVTGTFTISSYAFVVDDGGPTASEAFSASLTQTIRGSSITCTIDKAASYRKLGR